MNEKDSEAQVFDNHQMKEINLGRQEGLDVSIYEKKEYMAIQMRQIRLGLEKHLPVELYLNPEYDWFQMEEIRKGLISRVDVTVYANTQLDFKKMRQIRKGLENGINLAPYAKYDAGILEQLRKSIREKVKIVEYINQGYDIEQLEMIRYALVRKLNIKPYINTQQRGAMIYEIAMALESGIDPSILCDMEYNWQQMREIRLGIQERLDYHIYEDPLYSAQQMREIRLGLEEQIDVSKYTTMMYDSRTMKQKRRQLLDERKEKKQTEKVQIPSVASGTLPDGMTLCFEKNNMKAFIVIEKNLGRILDKEYFLQLLRDYGIVYGILEDAVEKVISGEVDGEILIAKGQKPHPGKNGYYEYLFYHNIEEQIQTSEDGLPDYLHIPFYTKVRAGDVIAVYHSATEGTGGFSVKGEIVDAEKGKEKNILRGYGFSMAKDGRSYRAQLDGVATLRENFLGVIPLLEIDEVNPVTGNVDFEGCVHVKGSISGNVTLQATDDIIVDENVLGGHIIGGRNILVRKGVNGGGDEVSCKIEAKENLGCGYLENIEVIAGKNIYTGYSMNSNLCSDEKIEIQGKRGRVIGGTVQAVSGISAAVLGNSSGIETCAAIGLQTKLSLHIESVLKDIVETKKQLEILTENYDKFIERFTAVERNAMPVFLKIENAIYTKKLEMKDLSEKKEQIEIVNQKLRAAEIQVKDTVYEGTVIRMEKAKIAPPMLQRVKFVRTNRVIQVVKMA